MLPRTRRRGRVAASALVIAIAMLLAGTAGAQGPDTPGMPSPKDPGMPPGMRDHGGKHDAGRILMHMEKACAMESPMMGAPGGGMRGNATGNVTPPKASAMRMAACMMPLMAMMMGLTRGTPERMEKLLLPAMILHLEQARATAELGAERAERPELASYARNASSTYGAAANQLGSWKDQWHGAAGGGGNATMPGARHGAMPAHAGESLRNLTGADFDRAFLNRTILDHVMLVHLAEVGIEAAAHPELADFARGLSAAQSQELEQLRSWRAAWYGGPSPPTTPGPRNETAPGAPDEVGRGLFATPVGIAPAAAVVAAAVAAGVLLAARRRPPA